MNMRFKYHAVSELLRYPLKELELNKSPGKSTIHRPCARIGIDVLVRVNDAIIARFKKILKELERSM